MLWALLDHLCHEVVEDGDLEDITFQDLSLTDLDVSERWQIEHNPNPWQP
jgi:hypothetical protein